MKNKKIIPLILVFVMVLSTGSVAMAGIPMKAVATKRTTPYGDIYIHKNSGHGNVISGAALNIKGIPSKVNGVTITRIISPGFTDSNKVKTFTIPKSVSYIESGTFNLASNTSFKVASGNKSFKASKGVLYNKKMTKLISYPYSNSSKSFTIPNSVTDVSGTVSMANKNLTSVTLGPKVKKVGAYAFSGCKSLKSIKIPSSNKNFKLVNGILMDTKYSNVLHIPSKLPGCVVILPDTAKNILGEIPDSTAVLGLPNGKLDRTEVMNIKGNPFLLFKNDQALQNNFDDQYNYATLTGGNIISAKASGNGTVDLNLQSIYYDKGSMTIDTFMGPRKIKKSTKDPWFMEKQFQIYRNGKKIDTIDYGTQEDVVKYTDKNPTSGKNSYYVIPKFVMKDSSDKNAPVTWYKSATVTAQK